LLKKLTEILQETESVKIKSSRQILLMNLPKIASLRNLLAHDYEKIDYPGIVIFPNGRY